MLDIIYKYIPYLCETSKVYFPVASVDYSWTLPWWKSLCHRWSRDQPQHGLSPNDKGGEGERAWQRGRK